MIGKVGTILGSNGVNIADMALGRDQSGAHALMVLSTDTSVSADALEELRAAEGILDARAIELD
jgi:D-3-phosphoglycerate dehydrogenase